MSTLSAASTPHLYGLMAEFETPEQLLAAAEKTRDAGYKKIEGYAPFPVEGLPEALGHGKTLVPVLVFFGGLAGGLSGYGLQYWIHNIEWPMNIAGRPYHSWPSFVPVTFEMTVLFAALTAVFGMIILNGLPKPYHPVFNAPRFIHASKDRFFLVIEAADAKFDRAACKQFLTSLGAYSVAEVDE